MHQKPFVCVECGVLSKELYKEFKGGNFKLCICRHQEEINLASVIYDKLHEFCHQRVDKYVEYDSVLVFLDVILHKSQAYRHVVFNKPPKVYWQLGIIFLLCDSYIKWYNVKHKTPRHFEAIVDFSILELQFYYMFLLSVLEMIVFLFGIFLGLHLYRLCSKEALIPSFEEILRVLLLSSFGKLLAFPAVIWGQTHSAVYLGLTKLLIFSSNTVAFKVLLHATIPSLFTITVSNALLYAFVCLYTTMQFHEIRLQ